MTRLLIIAILLLLQGCSGDRYSALLPDDRKLTIYSTTDAQLFAPLIEDFRRLYPRISVNYVEMESTQLHRRFLAESAAGKPRADVLLSAAMDLQVKLVNDGYAAPHRSRNGLALPNSARWREEAFGFTFEPAAMVFNTRLMEGRRVPRSRPELMAALRDDPDFWRGRIGTYDIATSSVGYLLASQDARHGGDFAALAQLLKQANVKQERTTGRLLDRVERGELLLAYNVLGSYAQSRIERGASLVVVYPEDYTLAVLRTALVPKNAPHHRAAHAFLEYLLSLRGQRILATRSHLAASRREIGGRYSRLGIFEATVGPLRPIGLGPGLLVYLDQHKRKRLLETWKSPDV